MAHSNIQEAAFRAGERLLAERLRFKLTHKGALQLGFALFIIFEVVVQSVEGAH